jgi:hypothetical protein
METDRKKPRNRQSLVPTHKMKAQAEALAEAAVKDVVMEPVAGWGEEEEVAVAAAKDAAINNNYSISFTQRIRRNTLPGFNRTGPEGKGPMTGGVRGRCAVTIQQNYCFPGTLSGDHRGEGRLFPGVNALCGAQSGAGRYGGRYC